MAQEWETRLKKFIATHKLQGIDVSLLQQALTHPSYAVENPDTSDYERLEFLGDAVLGLVMAKALFRTLPDDDEGNLTIKRAGLVQETALAKAGQAMDMGPLLRLGKGEEASGGAQRPSNIANALEAVIAAVYLSLGYDKAEAFVIDASKENIADLHRGLYGDYKTRLQEYIQQKAGSQVSYRMPEKKGPAHDPSFKAEVYIDGEWMGSGWGHSKKDAQREAALQALIALGEIQASAPAQEDK